MADVVEQTTTGGKTVTKFFSGFLTPQMAVLLVGAIFSVFVFWKNTTDNWKKTSSLEETVALKADKAEIEAKINSIKDQVNRQYERFNGVDAKIYDLQKERAYEKGYNDGEKDERKDQRRSNDNH